MNENGAPISLSALATDPDAGTTLTYTINTAGMLGTVTNNGNGTFTYSPNGAFESLRAGQTAQTTFSYTASDGSGGTSTATATITVTGENDAPQAAAVTGVANEDGPLITVSASVTDVDTNDTHTYSVDATGTLGAVSSNNNGTFDYHANGAFEALGAGETANDTFTYTVTDNHGGTSTATATITVTGTNDNPEVSVDFAPGGLSENAANGTVVGQVVVADADLSDGVSSRVLLNDAGGRFSLDGNDIVVERSILLDYDQAISHVITIEVTDLNGGVTSQDITINLTNQTPEDVTGTLVNDRIASDAGNDTLNGAGGVDTMLGGAGDDIYYVDAHGDRVVDTTTENSGDDAGGNDTVYSSVMVNLDGYSGIRVVENLTLTGSDNIVALGNALNNRLTGNSGNNVLNGATGNDTMLGMAGNDIYWINAAGDQAVETTTTTSGIDAGGIDLVQTTVYVDLDGYSGARFVEILTMLGADNIGAKGNGLANRINGNAGNNAIDGFTGADTMLGGAGDDTYTVDAAGDRVVETTTGTSGIDAGGIDTILTSVFVTLNAYSGIRFVENLTLTGSDNIGGRGNALGNLITGNGGNNHINGRTGADTMLGGAGNDTYIVDNVGDLVIESTTPISGTDAGGRDQVRSSVSVNLDAYGGARFVENLVLTGLNDIDGQGNTLNNVLTGNNANNVLNGGLGSDTMNGAGGNDIFMFDAAFEVGVFDRVVRFATGTDTIALDNAVFTALGLGTLAASAFASNLTGLATTADHRIIYETDTGRLFYDADGLGGAARVRFGALETNMILAHTDFLIV